MERVARGYHIGQCRSGPCILNFFFLLTVYTIWGCYKIVKKLKVPILLILVMNFPYGISFIMA